MSFFSGAKGSAVVNGTTMNITGWTCTVNGTLLDVTHTGSSGYAEDIYGPISAEGSVTFNWDSVTNPFDDPPNMDPTEGVTDPDTNVTLTLYIKDSSSASFVFPKVKWTSVEITSNINAVVSGSANFKSQGTFTPPTGAF